mmetsp:Transcript_11183/g.24027  ORF Transcript_11183/g.24027 Transcript_11183/m.24027 type:complete len:239 (+) Transcript_11183:17-733(+)
MTRSAVGVIEEDRSRRGGSERVSTSRHTSGFILATSHVLVRKHSSIVCFRNNCPRPKSVAAVAVYSTQRSKSNTTFSMVSHTPKSPSGDGSNNTRCLQNNINNVKRNNKSVTKMMTAEGTNENKTNMNNSDMSTTSTRDAKSAWWRSLAARKRRNAHAVMHQFKPRRFRAPWWASHQHAQTVLGVVFPRFKPVTYHPLRLTTPNGDPIFLDLLPPPSSSSRSSTTAAAASSSEQCETA